MSFPRIHRGGAVSLLVAAAGAAAAPQTPRQPATPAAFDAGTARVAVDLVVRGKDGALLRDLAAGDVEVLEDGVRQEVESLELVEPTGGGSGAAPASTRVGPPPLLAIVLDGLGPDTRQAAFAALRAHLGAARREPPLVAFFSIERGLRLLQPFTDNPETQLRALDSLASRASVAYSGLRERNDARHAHAGLGDGSPQTHVAAAEFLAEPECRAAGDDILRRLKLLSGRMKESFDALERDQQGAQATNALLALVDALKELPGRKAVLLFSEGLVLPTGAFSTFRSVVAAANRANVSVYATDAGGLRAQSSADETRRSLDLLRARLELVQAPPPGTRGPGSAEPGQGGLTLLEKNEDNLRLTPESTLGQLADQTGGFLVHGTNDLGSGLEHIEEELGSYYLLSYTPRNLDYDGRFRTIEVKLRRPHGRLQARRGYLAVRSPLPSPVLDHEARALARLDAGALPTLVPVRLRALQFPEAPPLTVVPIVMEVKTDRFPSRPDGEKDGALVRDFTIVAVVRDASGSAVAKASQRYRLAARRDDSSPSEGVLFYREAVLPPGKYTVEAVAQDAASSTAGGARVSLEAAANGAERLRASSLMLVDKAERLEAEREAAPRPLRFQDVLLYPHLGRPLRPQADAPAVLFVTAWPSPARPVVDARILVVRGDRVLSERPAGRHEPGPDGRVQLASSLPLAGFAPGRYELRVVLSDGRDQEVRSTDLEVAP